MATRRDFLKLSGAALALGTTTPLPRVLAAAGRQAAESQAETILVAIQMAGGNDGLNTVAPFTDEQYQRQRPTLALKAREVITLQEGWGFHPSLRPWMPIWEAGRLAVVQAVGYPNPSGAHERSMEIWQTARPDDPVPETGWLGRCVDHWFEHGPPIPQELSQTRAVFTGRIPTPSTLIGRHRPAVRCQNPAEFLTVPGGQQGLAALRQRLIRLPQPPRSDDGSLLRHIAVAQKEAARKLARIEEALSAVRPEEFPATYFGKQLACVATLIRAELGIRIFCVDLGGAEPGSFDTHALQAANHGALLEELAAGLVAFWRALDRDRLWDRVVVYTYSEFGRTVRENGRKGTDHGSAAPVFVLGGPVRGGLHGDHPPLSELENGGVKHRVDFRSLYATLLERWLHLPGPAILDGEFPHLEILA